MTQQLYPEVKALYDQGRFDEALDLHQKLSSQGQQQGMQEGMGQPMGQGYTPVSDDSFLATALKSLVSGGIGGVTAIPSLFGGENLPGIKQLETYRKHLNQDIEASDHPVANTIGDIASFFIPGTLPGKLGAPGRWVGKKLVSTAKNVSNDIGDIVSNVTNKFRKGLSKEDRKELEELKIQGKEKLEEIKTQGRKELEGMRIRSRKNLKRYDRKTKTLLQKNQLIHESNVNSKRIASAERIATSKTISKEEMNSLNKFLDYAYKTDKLNLEKELDQKGLNQARREYLNAKTNILNQKIQAHEEYKQAREAYQQAKEAEVQTQKTNPLDEEKLNKARQQTKEAEYKSELAKEKLEKFRKEYENITSKEEPIKADANVETPNTEVPNEKAKTNIQAITEEFKQGEIKNPENTLNNIETNAANNNIETIAANSGNKFKKQSELTQGPIKNYKDNNKFVENSGDVINFYKKNGVIKEDDKGRYYISTRANNGVISVFREPETLAGVEKGIKTLDKWLNRLRKWSTNKLADKPVKKGDKTVLRKKQGTDKLLENAIELQKNTIHAAAALLLKHNDKFKLTREQINLIRNIVEKSKEFDIDKALKEATKEAKKLKKEMGK